MRMVVAVTALLALLSGVDAIAAPPPAPPKYVYDAMRIFTASGSPDFVGMAALLADDVTILENVKQVASGREASMNYLRPSFTNASRKVIAYSQGYKELMMIDRYDGVDRSKYPPTMLVDPLWVSRSFLLQFDDSHRISRISIGMAEGPWAAAKD